MLPGTSKFNFDLIIPITSGAFDDKEIIPTLITNNPVLPSAETTIF